MHPIESDYRTMVIHEDRLREANESLWKRDVRREAKPVGLATAWLTSRLARLGKNTREQSRSPLSTRRRSYTSRLQFK